MKEVKYGLQEWLMLTVMLEFPSEGTKSGNSDRMILCAQIVVSVVSRVPFSCLFPVALWTRIRKSQPFPLSKILPRSLDKPMLWSSECVESSMVSPAPGITKKRYKLWLENGRTSSSHQIMSLSFIRYLLFDSQITPTSSLWLQSVTPQLLTAQV